MKNHIIETAERIVIDYANLTGRETANRAEFRARVIRHLAELARRAGADLIQIADRGEYEDLRREAEIYFIDNTVGIE